MKEIVMSGEEGARMLTLVVAMRLSRRFRFRFQLGCLLMRLGAWIAGINYEEESETE